jgi:ribosomal-protein-serine acetyltransferase
MELRCDPDTVLRSLTSVDAPALLAILERDRGMFDRWLRWSGAIRSTADAEQFLHAGSAREEAGLGFHWGIWRGGSLLGGVPCWSIDHHHRVAELGYWLAPEARGHGLATMATRVAMEHLFVTQGVNRVELQCRVENTVSRKVAERVGGRLEGVRRQSHWINGAFCDHAVYAILAEDWRATGS